MVRFVAVAATLCMMLSTPLALAAEGETHLAHGNFSSRYDHDVTGGASIARLDDGRMMLRLTNDFSSSGNPGDLEIRLMRASEPIEADMVMMSLGMNTGITVGRVGESNAGFHEFELPSNLNLRNYRSVAIYQVTLLTTTGAAALNIIAY